MRFSNRFSQSKKRPPTIRIKKRCFYGNLAKVFSIFHLSACRREKDPPTIRINNRRFGRVFFKKFTKSSKIRHRRKRFPYYTQKNTLLLRQSRERFFIFSSYCLIRKKFLLLYAQKTGILIPYFSKSLQKVQKRSAYVGCGSTPPPHAGPASHADGCSICWW